MGRRLFWAADFKLSSELWRAALIAYAEADFSMMQLPYS